MNDGKIAISRDGFSYLPRFISGDEADELIRYFSQVHPIWEQRHRGNDHGRSGGGARTLTRPVYWIGAWQFACLGYYSEPDYQQDRCVRAETYPAVMKSILERLRPTTDGHLAPGETHRASTSALINYYGSKLGKQPVDMARLRAHRDSEPGPVTMFSIGQPALFEFLNEAGEVHLSVWLRHRSVATFSGALFKDTLYHRVTQVRHGREPVMTSMVPDFALRRVSVSFRHVPQQFIHELDELAPEAREKVAEYVQELGEHSAHWREFSPPTP